MQQFKERLNKVAKDSSVTDSKVLVVSRKTCRSCGLPLRKEVLSLGNIHVVGFGDKENITAPLTLTLCNGCSLLQLRDTVNQDFLFGSIITKSGVNQSMRDHLAGIVRDLERRVKLKEGDIVVDVGCNDGTLLRAYPRSLIRIGFEPATNLVCDAKKGGNAIVNDFFGAEALLRRTKGSKGQGRHSNIHVL